MRELREDEKVKQEAQDKGITKGEMQVWLSKKGGETWAVMSAEEKKVCLLERYETTFLKMLICVHPVQIVRRFTTTGLLKLDQTTTPGRQSKGEVSSREIRPRSPLCNSSHNYKATSLSVLPLSLRFMSSYARDLQRSLDLEVLRAISQHNAAALHHSSFLLLLRSTVSNWTSVTAGC
jgi:hypothetical protein